MQKVLSELDDLIRRRLNPNEIVLQDGVSTPKFEIPDQVRGALQTLRKFSIDTSEQIIEKEAVSRFVNHLATCCVHQFQFLELYSKLGQRLFTPEARSVYKGIVVDICKDLDDFLSFLQFQFKQYFDFNLPVPYTRISKAQSSFKTRVQTLVPLGEMLGEYSQLLDVVLAPVQTLVKRGGSVTFRQMEYYQTLLDSLESLVETPPPDVNLALHRTLLSINFNSQDYIQYCIRQLYEKYGSLTLLEQLEKYNWYLKAQRQVDRSPYLALDFAMPSVFEQMDNYLVHEIAYIQTLIKLEAGYIDGVKVLENGNSKLRLNIPVDVAAVWLNVMLDTGFIQANSKEEAIETFCKVCSTVGADTVSHKSMRSKFFSLSQNAVALYMDLVHKQREASRAYIK